MVNPGFTRWALTIVVIALILTLIAGATVVMVTAVLQPRVSPTIKVQPAVVRPGDIVVVTGKGFPGLANLVVVVALSATRDLRPEGLVPVGAVPVALDGTLATSFVFPADVPWTALREAWVVARPATGSLQAVAHLVVQRLRPTPTPTPAVAATPLAGRQQIQGVVENLAPNLGLLTLRPFDGSASRGVIIRAAVLKFLDGRTATPGDLKVGSAIAALGWLDTSGSLMAEQITILEATAPAAPAPVSAPPPTSTPVLVVRSQAVAPTPVPAGAWAGRYFPNPWFMGTPVLERTDRVIDFNWRRGAPVAGMPSTGYSVSWAGNWCFPRTCRYRFLLLLKGSARVAVDGRLLINQWDSPPPAEYTAEMDLAAGAHALQVDYRNMGSPALVQLRWEYVNPLLSHAAQ